MDQWKTCKCIYGYMDVWREFHSIFNSYHMLYNILIFTEYSSTMKMSLIYMRFHLQDHAFEICLTMIMCANDTIGKLNSKLYKWWFKTNVYWNVGKYLFDMEILNYEIGKLNQRYTFSYQFYYIFNS